jgi:hypothetical protein
VISGRRILRLAIVKTAQKAAARGTNRRKRRSGSGFIVQRQFALFALPLFAERG